jgi:hypothetical protein
MNDRIEKSISCEESGLKVTMEVDDRIVRDVWSTKVHKPNHFLPKNRNHL